MPFGSFALAVKYGLIQLYHLIFHHLIRSVLALKVGKLLTKIY